MKKIAILGAGESGVGTAILAKKKDIKFLFLTKEQLIKNIRKFFYIMIFFLKRESIQELKFLMRTWL